MTIPSRTYEHLLELGWRPCLACGDSLPTRHTGDPSPNVADPNDDYCWRCAEEEEQRKAGVRL